MNERHFTTLRWEPFEVKANGETITCNLGWDAALETNDALCVIPTQALYIVQRPTEKLETAPNVLAEWMVRLLSACCRVLLVHGYWYDDLRRMIEGLNKGEDVFSRMTERIHIAIRECERRSARDDGRIVLMGSSRHGFAVLHAMANLPEIAAGVAHQPVVWWPKLKEFSGLDDHPIVRKNDLNRWIDRFPPRPLLVQTGHSDQRVGQDWLMRFIRPIGRAYRVEEAEKRFTHELMDLPGHDGTRIPMEHIDSVPAWIKKQGFFKASYLGGQ